ncbi:MptD family putative ECF transporter S component [Proteinivorax hydrogeniformans]|uniref:MptD family putative ECF transporter S component n=1 Tax=Proteinivorax hydrogeniformans TaxID=1826727 RepID=A0AAU8HSG8_9FIRM
MKQKAILSKDVALIGILAALSVVLGIVVLPVLMSLPLPIFKPIVLAPLFSLVVMGLMERTNKKGAVSLLAIVKGGLLSFFSPVMFLIVVFAGVCTEIINIILLSENSNNKKIIVSAAYSAFHVPFGVLFANVLLGYEFLAFFSTILLTILAFCVGGLANILMFKFIINKAFKASKS